MKGVLPIHGNENAKIGYLISRGGDIALDDGQYVMVYSY